MYTCRFLVSRLAGLRYGKDWLAQCQDNWMSRIWRHGVGSPVSQWGSIIKAPRVLTVTSQHPSRYFCRFCYDIKQQQQIKQNKHPWMRCGFLWTCWKRLIGSDLKACQNSRFYATAYLLSKHRFSPCVWLISADAGWRVLCCHWFDHIITLFTVIYLFIFFHIILILGD